MNRLRILLLAPGANPETISAFYVAYCHAEALARLHDVTLVIQAANEEPIRRAGAPFHAIEVVRQPWLDRIFNWCLRKIFKNNWRTQVLTAFMYPFAVAFEWGAWRRLRKRIKAGEFDVVLRLLPVNSVQPSPFGFFLRKGPIPFVVGPINGGLPWPPGFSQAENQKEWISRLRDVYHYLPFARSTFRYASAILAGSSFTCAEFAAYKDKVFFVPENGVNRSICQRDAAGPESNGKLELIFVGNLVPYKACDLALRGAAPLLQSGSAHFTILGDGPEQGRLEELARCLEIEKAVSFCGFVSHDEVMRRLRTADVLVFPSVREFGGGVVFEALAVGAVPVVADFGGPGDIVDPQVGRKVSLTNESDVVAQLEKVLTSLAGDRDLLACLRQQGIAYAGERLSWDGKAQIVTEILNWALRRGAKPDLPAPKALPIGG